MQLSLVRKDKVLTSHRHENQIYIEAPSKGKYAIRLYNNSPKRKLACVSVDGLNVLDRSNASYSGPGYVLAPWQTLDIPGWNRGDKKVAAFEFSEQDKSYSAVTGKGTENTGCIGVAVFDEKVREKKCEKNHYPIITTTPWVRPWTNPYPFYNSPYYGIPFYGSVQVGDIPNGDLTVGYDTPIGTYCSVNTDGTIGSSGGVSSSLGEKATKSLNTKSVNMSMLRSASSTSASSVSEAPDLGTKYGKELDFKTFDTEFVRASTSPCQVLSVRYAVKAKLIEWGVPLDNKPAKAPNPFPAQPLSQQVGCPAPLGWQP